MDQSGASSPCQNRLEPQSPQNARCASAEERYHFSVSPRSITTCFLRTQVPTQSPPVNFRQVLQ